VKAYPSFLRETNRTLVIGFNCGFGNFDNSYSHLSNLSNLQKQLLKYQLLLDWIYDLSLLTQLFQKCPFFFFCANDYSDLIGEIHIILHLLGMNIIIEPQENPYSMASTMVAENSNSGSSQDYSRGNSFYYGFQGISTRRRVKLSSLKEFSSFQAVNPDKKILDNPYALSLLKEILPHLQKIPHYSQALQYLVQCDGLPFKLIEMQQVQQQEQSHPESKEYTGISNTEGFDPSSTANVTAVLESSALNVVEIDPNSAEDLRCHMATKQSLVQHNLIAQQTELLLEISSSVVDLKSVDLQLNRNGNELMIKYNLTKDEIKGSNSYEEKVVLLVQNKIDPVKAVMKAKLSSKKKILSLSILF
jgi:hypothetical protein